MKCVVLDLEFTDLVPEDDLESSSLRISCAATLLSDSHQSPLVWTPDASVEALTVDTLVHLVAYLQTMTSMGQMLVTWGGMSADFRMLCKECPQLRSTIQQLALHSIDVPFVSACHQGMMMSLSSAADGIGIQGKDTGVSKEVPEWWRAGLRQKVHEHVCTDVRLTMEVFLDICHRKSLVWKTQRGFVRHWAFPFQRVSECLQVPKPVVPFEIKKSMDPKVQAQWLQT